MPEGSVVGTVPQKGSFVRADLAEIGRCPARADFVELHFTTEVGRWKWCFPDPRSRETRTDEQTLVLVLGRYGTQAHLVVDGAIGPALPSSEALPMILGGSRPFVSRKLIESGV
ncbi:hypothetical protein LWC35_24150 [Pseudonocardia kujensis]|uniref:hypothetical protein n=1 Tax=Pseudonocardia kujensis TaxID=1128675 RepID=UPI001E2D6689|nr:hypothetical protein [Pseudonocardia kujensis]MCE0765971.1 hypothetical protein [Pseudonocardia kujensis]